MSLIELPLTNYDSSLLTTSIERNFDLGTAQQFVQWFYSNYIHHLLIGYLVTIFAIKSYMRDQKPYELRRPLIAWNFLLSIFSFLGAIRTGTELFSLWANEGFLETTRHPGYHMGVTGFWTFLFVMSKVPEFIDTLFIVLRKKPLIFLHYYHHVETCWFALFTYPMNAPVMRWGIFINFSVHAIMYAYYGSRALNIKVPTKIAMAITSLQTLQMFICIAVGISAFRCDNYCTNDSRMVLPGFATYVIYAILFSHYFYKSYFSKSSHRLKKQEQKSQ